MQKMNCDTFESFVTCLQKSELIDEVQLTDIVKRVGRFRADRDRLTALQSSLLESGVLTQWQCNKIAMGKFKGFFLDDFVLIDHVGRGNTTTSYAARNRHTGEQVILEVQMPTAESAEVRYQIHRKPEN